MQIIKRSNKKDFDKLDDMDWAVVTVMTKDSYIGFARVAEFEHWLACQHGKFKDLPRKITWH